MKQSQLTTAESNILIGLKQLVVAHVAFAAFVVTTLALSIG